MNDQDLNNIRGIIKEEVTASEERVIVEVGIFVEDVLLPAIEEKADRFDIDRLEIKLDHFSAQVAIHDQAIKEIKSTPTVAHELNFKKKIPE